MNTTELVFEVKPEKNLGPYRIWTHNLCDTSAALYQLSQEFKSHCLRKPGRVKRWGSADFLQINTIW